MEAGKFIKEKERMCESFTLSNGLCNKCGLHLAGIICTRIASEDAEEAVRIVEEWSKAHPIQTNEDKFKEVFGFEPYTDMAWAAANDEYAAELHDTAWWEKPYEAPKGADNAETD